MKNLVTNLFFFIFPSVLLTLTAIIYGENILNNSNKYYYGYLLDEDYLNNETNNINTNVNNDLRVQALHNFFDKYNSPLKDHSHTFVAVADEYGLDYKLLPAISCMESTCGKKIIKDSYNPFGWGIYGNNYIKFENYDEAIKTVAKGIFNGYISKGLDTAEKMAPVYTPPNSSHWLSGVNFFIYDITEFEQYQKNIQIKNKVLHYL